MSGVYFFLTGLLQPYRLCVLLTAAGLAYAWYTAPGARRRLLWFALPFAGLTLLSLPVLSYLAMGSLEWQYPPLRQPPAYIEALVVLGGGIRPADAVRPRAEPTEDTVYRCLCAAELYRAAGGCPVVVSGGRMTGSSEPSCAEVMRDFLTQLGVSSADISTEGESQTTYENAADSRKLLEARGVRRIVLVTDAVHSFRAERCFRKQGLEVVPAPCNYRATSFNWSALQFVPEPYAALRSAEAFHEWVGTLWYWLTGRI
jgi:uncharacterized SAM-binding protein YcdF (DUF218 family)